MSDTHPRALASDVIDTIHRVDDELHSIQPQTATKMGDWERKLGEGKKCVGGGGTRQLK